MKPVKYSLKFLSIIAIASLLFLPTFLQAQSSNSFITSDDIEAEIVPRMEHKKAEIAITNREGSVDLLLTDQHLLIQFTDQFFDEIEKEIKAEENISEASHIGDVFKSMITSGIQTFLDRALAIPLYEIAEIYYDNGTLFIVDHAGENIFDDLDINDKKVMEDFSRRDARRFVAEAEKRMI